MIVNSKSNLDAICLSVHGKYCHLFTANWRKAPVDLKKKILQEIQKNAKTTILCVRRGLTPERSALAFFNLITVDGDFRTAHYSHQPN